MSKWLRSQEQLQFSVAQGVAVIRLNRPHKRNALNWDLLTELRGALLEADDLNAVHVIVVEGAGKDFCSGYDLQSSYDRYAKDATDEKPLYRTGASTVDNDSWRLERFQELVRTPFMLHKPVIAKVHGHCVAGGTDLALYCDLIIAAEDARIGFPATRSMGTPPNHMWLYNVGPQWAKRLLMSGDLVLGADAARLGLVQESVPAAQLDAHVEALARRLATIDHELLCANKRIVNIALEVAGAGTIARLAAELDARAHTTQAKKHFDQQVADLGLKAALKARDEPFGDGIVRPSWR